MSDSGKEAALAAVKENLREQTYPFFTDEQLLAFLQEWNWNVEQASYHALVYKAENDAMTLPSGLSMPNNRDYWLTLARRFRANAGGTMKRSDDR